LNSNDFPQVTFATGNGVLRGHIVDTFELGGELFYVIRDQFRDERALRANEFQIA
jgi:hypothetical protein